MPCGHRLNDPMRMAARGVRVQPFVFGLRPEIATLAPEHSALESPGFNRSRSASLK
jgi:hypothetical protein